MRETKRHLSSLDRIEPPDLWERVASWEPSTGQRHDEDVTASPWKRGIAVVVAFAVFGAAALFMIRAFDAAPTDRDGAPRESPSGDARGAWQSVPEGPLSPRHGAFAFWVEGHVVIIGGADSPPCPPTANCGPRGLPLRDGAAFAPSSGTWTTIAPSPVPITRATGAVLGDTIYLLVPSPYRDWVGTSFLSYNVNTDRWEELPTPPGVFPASLLLVATDDAIVAYPDSQERGVFPDLLFEPSTGGWRELPPDPLAPSFDRSMVWTGEELLLFAIEYVGQPEVSRYPNHAAALDIATGRWRRLPDPDIAVVNPNWFWSAGLAVNPTIGHVGDNGSELGSGPRMAACSIPGPGRGRIFPRPRRPAGSTADQASAGASTSSPGRARSSTSRQGPGRPCRRPRWPRMKERRSCGRGTGSWYGAASHGRTRIHDTPRERCSTPDGRGFHSRGYRHEAGTYPHRRPGRART